MKIRKFEIGVLADTLWEEIYFCTFSCTRVRQLYFLVSVIKYVLDNGARASLQAELNINIRSKMGLGLGMESLGNASLYTPYHLNSYKSVKSIKKVMTCNKNIITYSVKNVVRFFSLSIKDKWRNSICNTPLPQHTAHSYLANPVRSRVMG